jgi:hypothetical protein
MHAWKFRTKGGFTQVNIDTGADILALPELDPKLWAVLSAPVKTLDFDAKTLAFLDNNADGRIRVTEVKQAAAWLAEIVREPAVLTRGAATLALDHMRDDTALGRAMRESAARLLAVVGKAAAGEITLDDVVAAEASFAKQPFNGDGVVPPGAAGDAALAQALADAVTLTGGTPDASGAQGVTQAQLDAFFAALEAYAAWARQAVAAPAPAAAATGAVSDPFARHPLMPFGEDTAAAFAAYEAVRAKIDDYFARAALAAFDPDARARLNLHAETYDALRAAALAPGAPALAALPLAQVGDEAIDLTAGVNPAFRGAAAAFRGAVLAPLGLEAGRLTPDAWARVGALFAPYAAWLAAKPAGGAEALGLARAEALLAPDVRGGLAALVAEDLAMQPHADNLASLDKLLRYVRDLQPFLRNFVTLDDFYDTDKLAVFQAGTLFIDGRSCILTMRVENAAKHAALASQSRTYLLYCDLTRAGGAEKRTILAAVTAGDSANLMVGRNGVFVDRAGQEWDATVVQLVDNPISIRQAIFAPYRKASRLINEQIQKLAASKEKGIADKTAGGIEGTVAGGPKAPEQPFDVAKFAGIFAAIGLAVGTLGAALASLLAGFMTLSLWQMPLALAGIAALISGPSAALAALKMRNRNIAPILDANGWAVNANAKINLPFGATLTQTAALPPGAALSLLDPYQEEESHVGRNLIIAALLLALGAGAYYWFFARTPAPAPAPAPAAAPATPVTP